MIKEMERLVKHEKLHRNDHDDDDKNKKASTTVQDEDMLMRINVELSSVTFHLHFLTRPPSVMKLEFEKLQTMLTYRRKYFQVRACVGDALVSHDDGRYYSHYHSLNTHNNNNNNNNNHQEQEYTSSSDARDQRQRCPRAKMQLNFKYLYRSIVHR